MKQESSKKPRKLSAMQQVITKHVADMSGCYDAKFWKREGKIYSTLLKIYGKDFLLWVGPPEDKKISSLVFYLSVHGKYYLSDKLVEFTREQTPPTQKEEISLSEHKIEKDIIFTHKPKTLKDFLNYGKTK